MKLSVVVPIFNEERKIQATLSDISHYLNRKEFSYEIIPVNDGSTDTTETRINDYADGKTQVKPISYENNKGKGYAVKKGIIASTGELVIFTDSDLSAPLKELDKMLEYIGEYDIVIGSRVAKDHNQATQLPSPFYRLLRKIANWLINLLLQIQYLDTQCGFKLFTRPSLQLFKQQKINGFGFDFEILFLAKKGGYKVKELPITWKNSANSKFGVMDWLFTFFELVQVRLNALRGLYKSSDL